MKIEIAGFVVKAFRESTHEFVGGVARRAQVVFSRIGCLQLPLRRQTGFLPNEML